MQQLQILLVEGNPHFSSLLTWHLQQAGHQVQSTVVLKQAKEILQHQLIHLLILDADLSNRAGLQLCHWAHRHSSLLILLLSSRDADTDIVSGLQAGADDYLVKPLSMQVLAARIEAMARRVGRMIPPTYLQYGDLQIDLVQRRVSKAGQGIDLTPQEFSLLLVLVQADGNPMSRQELLDRAWPDAIDNPRTVDTHILSLRKKVETDPRQPSLIQTVRNVGYCFAIESKPSERKTGVHSSLPPSAPRQPRSTGSSKP